MEIQIQNQIYPVKICHSFYTRFKGMMFERKKLSYGFYFPHCSSIHTFFMKQNIDVIMVDHKNRVLAFYKDVKPWKILHKKAYGCFEFSSGILPPIQIGDVIKKKEN